MMKINEYAQTIKETIGIILRAVELEVSVNFVFEASLAYDIAKELYYEFDANFEEYTEDLFDEILNENDMLSVCVTTYSDGVTRCFLQPVIDEDGDTYPDECSDVTIIQEELLDKVDVDAFNGIVVVLQKEKEIEEDEIEDLGEVLALELLATLGEMNEFNKDAIFTSIANKLNQAYQIGFLDGESSKL